MKTFKLIYYQSQDIEQFIRKHKIDTYSTILVQMYSDVFEKEKINKVILEIKRILPWCQLVGMTSGGGISDENMATEQIAISFLIFEKTAIQTMFVPLESVGSHKQLGEEIERKVISANTKLVLLLASGPSSKLGGVVSRIGKSAKRAKVFGVKTSAWNGYDKETYIWLNNRITSDGIIAISLNSEDLFVHSIHHHSWKEIGAAFTITKAESMIIKEINHERPAEVLRNYLGERFTEDLHSSSSLFPLMTIRNGKKTPLFITKILDEGWIQVDQSICQGDKFTFSYADIEKMMNVSITKLIGMPAETILILSCCGSQFVQKESAALQKKAPCFGYFSTGELFGMLPEEKEFISSFLCIALSEKKTDEIHFGDKTSHEINSAITLSHLLDASTRDIQNHQTNIQKTVQRYRSLFEHNSDIVFSLDLHGRITSVNPRFTEIFGFTKKQIISKNALSFIKLMDTERVTKHFYQSLEGVEQVYEVDLIQRDGTERRILIKHIPIIVNGEIEGIYGIGRDITAQKQAEERIAYLASFDPETSLPNRQNFNEHLNAVLHRMKKNKGEKNLAVLFIDIDRFKIINDSLGHCVGDRLLIHIIERMNKVLPANSFLARFGGDKFILSLSSFRSLDDVINLEQVLLNTIKKPILYKEKELYVTASIGVSLYPNDGEDHDGMLKNADPAMNQAKKQGGNRIKFYSNEMNHQALFRIELESYLRKALDKKEFFLCYQPLIDIKTKQVHGAEALLRWNHPKLGLVSPAEFIPLAEETGIITEIGIWVLHTACRDAKNWHDKGLGDLTVSVNVSAHQFQQATFIVEVKKALENSGLAPRFLQLELTESVMLRNATYSIAVMKELQELGVQLSVDDFGTGYSSLSYLRDLPINNLKIDRSFIKKLGNDAKDVAIVNAIITMGKGLNLKVFAEGIETEEQLCLLEALACDAAQGYFMSKPKVLGEFVQFIKRRSLGIL